MLVLTRSYVLVIGLLASLGASLQAQAGSVSTPASKLLVTGSPYTFVEDFTSNALEDADGSGALWGASNGVGGMVLRAGVGGGGGQLGPLRVPAGVQLVLSTDLEDFSSIVDPTIYDPALQVRPASAPNTPLVSTGGIFALESLVIEAGGALRFEGTHPARVYVRGTCRIDGALDVSGTDALDHFAIDCVGGPGGPAGPGGGEGGAGGARPGTAAFANTALDGDVVVPNAPIPDCPLVGYGPLNGAPGLGVSVPNALQSTGSAGGGGGGLAWPQPLGSGTFALPTDQLDFQSQEYSTAFQCRIAVPGSPGAGGANALHGDDSILSLPPAPVFPSAVPPNAVGGPSLEIIAPTDARGLDPLLGLLRGGAGGGGAGAHLQRTRITGFWFIDCAIPAPGTLGPLRIIEYVASSSAGGGGGGGAVQVQAGRGLSVSGVVLATGGRGGSDEPTSTNPNRPTAQAGGGGAGGSILLQAPSLSLAPLPARIDLTGGDGGVGTHGSHGGRGGPGLLRVETIPALAVSDLAPLDCPGGPVGCSANFYSNSPVFPDPDELFNPFVFPDLPGIDALFSTAEWTRDERGVGRLSGSLSCWIRPPGSYNALTFPDDVTGFLGQVLVPAWDVELSVTGLATPISLRTTGVVIPGLSVEELLELIGVRPIVVYFQAARLQSTVADVCDVELHGASSPVVPGSLTPWVTSSAELDDFHGGNLALRPNAFRYQICFDQSDPFLAPLLSAVSEFRVDVDRR